MNLITVLSKSLSVSKFADRFRRDVGPDRIRNRGGNSRLVPRDKLMLTMKHSILEKKVREKNADTSQIEAKLLRISCYESP